MQKLNPLILLLLLLTWQNSVAQIPGCIDPLATNYNNGATLNDGSCVYTTVYVTPATTVILDPVVSETSGLIAWNNHLLTINDDADTYLHELDTLTGAITNGYFLPNVNNYDWEEISQDSLYIYVGDFGNNTSGNRTDMHVLRVLKSTLTSGAPQIDTIYFSYADQTDFTAVSGNQTDFDCESMIVTEDSIFLFQKQWVSHQTKLYGFPNIPGTYSAPPLGTCTVNGMITGATYLKEKRLVVLCGYTTSISPFFFLLYDYPGHNFFGGNKRKIGVSLSFEQTEGVATVDGLKYYMSNERFDHSPIYNSEALYTFDLSSYLSNYISGLTLSSTGIDQATGINIFPNPFTEQFNVRFDRMEQGNDFRIFDINGKEVFFSDSKDLNQVINGKNWSAGTYFVKTPDGSKLKIIKN